MTQKLLTVKEVGEILDLKPARIYELTREKRIPFVQIGESYAANVTAKRTAKEKSPDKILSNGR